MKTKRRLLSREEPLDVEDKYFGGGLGNLLSLGAAHFRQSNRKNGRRPTATARLIPAAAKPRRPDVKTTLTAAEKWWNDCAEYERTHEIAFASPRVAGSPRMIEAMDKARRPHRRNHRNGVAHRRKVAARRTADKR